MPISHAQPFAERLVLRSADLLSLQSLVLEAVARGASLHHTLDLLCSKFEALAPEVRCSVLLLDGDVLRHGAAPSLPEAYTRAIDGARIGPMVGSCGTAAYTGEEVEVTDIANDPRWADYKHVALPHGLRACWSSPIFGPGAKVLGTFALYYGEIRAPSDFHREAVQAATDLAAIAIQRHHMDEAERERIAELEANHAQMARLNQQLEQRVAERTADLDQRNSELQRTIDELQRTQGALIEARKLLSLGRLVAGVAHELNTPIGNARLLASSLHERCAGLRHRLQTQLKRQELESFIDAVEDGSGLLDQALRGAAERISSFRSIVVERDEARRTRFQLSELVDEALMLLAPMLREAQCQVRCDVPAPIALTSYPGQLQQVLSNVLSNAIVHGFAGRLYGHIDIHAHITAENRVVLQIHDDGCGISEADQARVFDPFFTTQLGQGCAGLGLHVAYTVVHGLLGGDITLSSQPGAGTSVTLSLPLEAPTHALPSR